MITVRKFLSKLIIAITIVIGSLSGAHAAEFNLTSGDIGDMGTWATDANRELVVGKLDTDLRNFLPSDDANPLIRAGVPIDARIGLAFMNGLSSIGAALDSSLVRFMMIFMLIAYAFWIMMEAYNMMTTTSDVKKMATDIVKKGVILAIWLIVLNYGMREIFTMVIGPIISLGTYLSDIILNAITATIGTSLPDTCGAIHNYVATHAHSDILINPENAADIMCVPAPITTFAITGIAAGWKWITASIGVSMFTFVAGVGCIILFAFLLWRFFIAAFGVITDLFLAVLLLPFTAAAETLNKTSYKGIAGSIYNGFLEVFKAEPLQKQILRFVKAAIYFVSLSIVIGVCGGLLSAALDANLLGNAPVIEYDNFLTLMLTGALVAYIAYKGLKTAEDLGGSIDKSFAERVIKDGKNLFGVAKTNFVKAKNIIGEALYKTKKK